MTIMRAKRIPELDQSVLVGAVIRAPMIVHEPGIKPLCRLYISAPGLGMELRTHHGSRK